MPCFNCGTTERELRPYGPGRKDVCVPCLNADPELKKIAQANFGAILNSAEAMSPTNTTILTETGVHPLDIRNFPIVKCHCVPDKKLFALNEDVYIDGKKVEKFCTWPECINGNKSDPNG